MGAPLMDMRFLAQLRHARRSEIEVCADADASRMQARLSYVSIAALPGYTSKRLLVRNPGQQSTTGLH